MPPEILAQDIETSSFLGPFFRLSPLQAEVAKSYFLGTAAQPESVIRNAQNSLRMALKTHQDELFDIVNVMIKTGKGPRERILDWFALTVNANHKRRAMQVDFKTVSTDALMVNVTVSPVPLSTLRALLTRRRQSWIVSASPLWTLLSPK